MGLQLYKKKRNFRATPEPSGKLTKSKSKLKFVVQRHKASHLHYDFRLEMEGVLKSWAVPKGPSLNPQDKRLAMMVEDHPYSYRTFAGIIPEGNYGAGIVEIWDEGDFSDLENSDQKTAEKKLLAGLNAGSIKFRLHGKKLKGEFALVKIKGRGENNWLLIKHNDEYAVHEEYNSENQTPKNSPINKWLSKNGRAGNAKAAAKKRLSKTRSNEEIPQAKKNETVSSDRKLSNYIKPMLAKETDTPFSNKEWIYEIKWDGYRAIAEINKTNAKLYSRNGNSFNSAYPIVTDALEKLNVQAAVDGEIVIVDENGKSNFQLLQHYQTNNNYIIEYRVFDLLSLNGIDTTDLPLVDRKKLLKELLPKNNKVIKYSDHIEETGEEFFAMAVKNDLEGIMAKKADSLYTPGVRTSEWLKVKHHKTQEAVIAGFTAPGGSRKHFGALILGIWDEGNFKYIGHTGSGFDTKTLEEMSKLLKPLITNKSPFAEKVKTNTPATWVKPELVCEIKFTEWTRDGNLRHPIFLRLRDDKTAKEVTMAASQPVKKATIKKITSERKKEKKVNHAKENILSFGKIKVKTTNINKLYFPDEEITKGDVIEYYQSISKYILPFLKDRPQSLKRNPNGINDHGFFHKDAGEEAPSFVKSKKIYSESTNKDVEYIICNNAATLAYMNNLGCIEINPWHSTVQKLDKPDYLIIDIDPSDKNTFEQVIETANVIRDIFKRIKVESYCKTSGATGLHVYVPTQKKYTYEQLKDFSHMVCIMAREELPDFTSLERNLKKRGNKMIYLDHLQNRRGQTISSVYSLRPKPGAPVSIPLKWPEVKTGLSPLDFNITNALKRIEKNKDLFLPVLGKGIDLQKCLKLMDKIR